MYGKRSPGTDMAVLCRNRAKSELDTGEIFLGKVIPYFNFKNLF